MIYTAHGFHFYNGAPLKNWIIFYPIERAGSNAYIDGTVMNIGMDIFDRGLCLPSDVNMTNAE